MKKTLLLLFSGIAGVSSLMAQEESYAWGNPTVFRNVVWEVLSPDNHYAVSNFYGYMSIVDLATGKIYNYVPEEDDDYGYSTTNGNGASATGVILGGSSSSKNALYWKDGEWHNLPVLDESKTNIASGITKDGTRICGNLGMHAMTVDDDVIMQTPYYWDLLDDGEYSAPKPLPYPTVDFSGRTPQYITATCISDDGKTILGQIHDYSGFGTAEPILYTQDSDGEWSYTLPLHSYINPNGLVLPEYPGEAPQGPSERDFMTQEEIDAYNAAVDEYWQTYENWPNIADFMSPEEAELYNAAKAAWQEEFSKWSEEWDAFRDAFYAILDESPSFQYNSIAMSGNGRYIILVEATEEESEDSWFPVTVYKTWRFDLTTSEVVKYEYGTTFFSNQVFDDGRVVFKNSPSGYGETPFAETYISDAATSDLTAITDYVEAKQPTLAAWMREYMLHTVEQYVDVWDDYGNYDGQEVVESDYYLPGRGIIAQDESLLITWVENSWDYSDESPAFFGYMFDLTSPVSAGVGSVAVDDSALTVKVDAEGTIYLSGKAAKLEIFDLSGRCVRSYDNPSVATTTLLNGLYIVKATAGNGTSTVVKATL